MIFLLYIFFVKIKSIFWREFESYTHSNNLHSSFLKSKNNRHFMSHEYIFQIKQKIAHVKRSNFAQFARFKVRERKRRVQRVEINRMCECAAYSAQRGMCVCVFMCPILIPQKQNLRFDARACET